LVKAKFAPAAGEQGKTVAVQCQLDEGAQLPDKLTATLDGLPPRTTAQPVNVAGSARKVEFKVNIDPTTPPGEHRSLVCELTGAVDGQKVVYRVGRGGSLRVDVPGSVKTDEKGTPLSPLEALRLEQKRPAPPGPAQKKSESK
jgi:hypothetical protein